MTVSANPIIRTLLIVIGGLSVILGVIGIFLPLLPTTPFLLLAALCFSKSSHKFHDWLIQHPKLGVWINGYLSNQGLPLKAKIYAIGLMWLMMSTSLFFIGKWWLAAIIIPIGLGVSLYIGTRNTLVTPKK